LKDFLGRDLAIGDSVIIVTPSYRSFTLARVHSFTATKVRVEYSRQCLENRKLLQDPVQICKVDGPDLTMYLLKK
jgi:hypothetical protein